MWTSTEAAGVRSAVDMTFTLSAPPPLKWHQPQFSRVGALEVRRPRLQLCGARGGGARPTAYPAPPKAPAILL